jgi:2-polyprenyl-6-hydroxyphenyl methylase/3-demethylubiquinone-9 3-methyltransferase
MVVATINRTLAALLIAIVGAEYVLGWMPKGTHHWRKPVKPSEATAALGDRFRLLERTGVRINPLDRSFHFSRYMGVNFMMVLRKVAA